MTKDKMTFKEISKIHKECPVCEIERDLIYGETRDILNVRGLDIDVASKIYYCPDRDHFFYSFEDEEAKFQYAYREYKKRKGLLQSEEILQIREQYGLTQKSLAALLGWGDVTPSRYETGAIQNDSNNSLLLMIRDFDGLKNLFKLKKDILEPSIAKDIEEKIAAIEINSATKVFSMSKQTQSLPVAPIQSAIGLYYPSHNDNSQACSNNELALAA